MYYSLQLLSTRPAASRFPLSGLKPNNPSPSLVSSALVHSHSLRPQTPDSPQLSPLSKSRSCPIDRSVVVDSVLPAGVTRDRMPRHVAVIMDGNVRWARQRGLPGSAGHEIGLQKLWDMADTCLKWEIKVLTVFAFSTENWARPKDEVDFLMALFEGGILNELDNFVRKGIRVSVIGDISSLPRSLSKAIALVEETTKSIPAKLNVAIAFGYSGRYDIVQACTSIANKVKEGDIELDEIDESLFESELKTNRIKFPNPDLMIRTSGELRVSNFFLWQLAYTELYFADSFWPDFDEREFAAALRSYQQRDRRFGARARV